MRRLSGVKAIAFGLVFAVILLGTSCAGERLPTPTVDARLARLQQSKYVTARLLGTMTMEFGGQTIIWPVELAISSVPVTWMGQVFNGRVEVNDLVDQIHGGVSEDGEWLLSFSYTRTVKSQNGVTYTVQLRNLPIAATTNSTALVAQFDRQGDVEKYLEGVHYRAGGVNEWTWKEVSGNYTITDWTAAVPRVTPALKVAFEVVPSQDISSGESSGGM